MNIEPLIFFLLLYSPIIFLWFVSFRIFKSIAKNTKILLIILLLVIHILIVRDSRDYIIFGPGYSLATLTLLYILLWKSTINKKTGDVKPQNQSRTSASKEFNGKRVFKTILLASLTMFNPLILILLEYVISCRGLLNSGSNADTFLCQAIAPITTVFIATAPVSAIVYMGVILGLILWKVDD